MPRAFFTVPFFLSSQMASQIQLQGEQLFTGSQPGPQPARGLKGLDSSELGVTLGRRGAAVRVRDPAASSPRLPRPMLPQRPAPSVPRLVARLARSGGSARGRGGQCPRVTQRARPSAQAARSRAVIGRRRRG